MQSTALLLLFVFLILPMGSATGRPEMEEILRYKMVQRQLENRDIQDARILQVFREVPRHEFVPDSLKGQAYEDRPLPIGYSQTISQPYIVAFMTQALQLKPEDRVLEIGTGSGYQAAVLSELVKEVYSIEIVPELAKQSKRLLKDLFYENVEVKEGDGYQGWPEHGPFDAIIVTAAPGEIPQKLVEQLKSPGGRMIVPVGDKNQELILITKTESGVEQKSLLPVRFVPMIHDEQST